MKKWIALALICFLLGSLFGCSSQEAPATTAEIAATEDTVTVGIALPDRSAARWETDSVKMVEHFSELGYKVLLEYAENDGQVQLTQLERLIQMPVDCLIVAAVDSLVLSDALEKAETAGIPVIAYDRMMLQTSGVTCGVLFDYYSAGKALGAYVADTKRLQAAESEQRSYTVEFFMGSPDDNNARIFHQGLLEVLQTYLDSGVLVCRSGRVAFEDTYVQNWDAGIAQTRCEMYLREFYGEEMPNILCAASDALASGCSEALWLAECSVESWPLITGQGAHNESAVTCVASGEQTVSTYQDLDALREKCIEIAEAVLSGNSPALADAYHNGVEEIPVYLQETPAIDRKNYADVVGYSADVPEQIPPQEELPPDTTAPEQEAVRPETQMPLPDQKETEPSIETTPD